MLLLRGDLLLVAQIKALIGSALTTYDHWKCRGIIEWGCTQAKKSAKYITGNTEFLTSILGKAAAGRVKYVEPVVLTNLAHFDGWVWEGVPILSEVGRKSITIGSKVDYHDSKSHETVHTHDFVKEEDLCTETILWLLKNPLEIRISPESTNVTYREMEIAGITWMRPEFALKTDADVVQPHEPRFEVAPQA